MKRYYDLTKDEKLNLEGLLIHDSIKLEAIHRGIKPPVTLDAIIAQHGFRGFSIPPDSVVFYELVGQTRYGSTSATGMAFKTEEAAKAALEGAIFLEEEGYGVTKKVVPSGFSMTYRAVFVGLNSHKPFGSNFEEYTQDDTEFDALSDEIRKELNEIWQESYNTKVNAERKKEYLRLAGGNEDIAKAFWDKSEKTPWPTE